MVPPNAGKESVSLMDSGEAQITVQNSLSHASVTLHMGRCLRTVPGRRAVYEGTCSGNAVILKIFSSRLHGRRHYRRELNGLTHLQKRGLPTAGLIACGPDTTGRWVLVQELIPNARDVHSILKGLVSREERTAILENVMVLLAQMHEAGVVQRDLHLGNFLWNGTEVFALDPAQMHFYRKALCRSRSIKQAAMLAAGLGPEEKSELLGRYFGRRQWTFTEDVSAEIERQAASAKQRMIKRYLKKTLRTCTDFVRLVSGPWCGVFDRSVFDGVDLAGFMAGLNETAQSGRILKPGNTCFVSRIRLGTYDLVVKRYNHKGFLHALRHTIKGSRARKCWLFGHRLGGLGIACARPVAFIEKRTFGIITESYILNEYVDGPASRDYLLGKDLAAAAKIDLRKQIDCLIGQLSDHRIVHRDLKDSNILIRRGRPVLIDLDSMSGFLFKCLEPFFRRKMETKVRERIYHETDCF